MEMRMLTESNISYNFQDFITKTFSVLAVSLYIKYTVYIDGPQLSCKAASPLICELNTVR